MFTLKMLIMLKNFVWSQIALKFGKCIHPFMLISLLFYTGKLLLLSELTYFRFYFFCMFSLFHSQVSIQELWRTLDFLHKWQTANHLSTQVTCIFIDILWISFKQFTRKRTYCKFVKYPIVLDGVLHANIRLKYKLSHDMLQNQVIMDS